VLEDALMAPADPREGDTESEVYLMDVPSAPPVDNASAAQAG